MEATLKRIASRSDGTFGVLIADTVPFAVTAEPPWRGNAPNQSCIPLGEYVCKRVNSPKFGNTFEITNVPSRTDILFHQGNTMDDTLGCVLIGEQFEHLNGKVAVLTSFKGFQEFMQLTKDVSEFKLTVLQV
jgi:hypothetical protein